MLHLKAFIDGPPQSVYEDARFEIDIVVPTEYPVKPPTCRAIQKILHPNINGESICIDILNSSWSPALKLSQVLLSISSLLLDPDVDNGYGNEASDLMYQDMEEFNRVAREWVVKYALKPEIKEKMDREAQEAADLAQINKDKDESSQQNVESNTQAAEQQESPPQPQQLSEQSSEGTEGPLAIQEQVEVN